MKLALIPVSKEETCNLNIEKPAAFITFEDGKVYVDSTDSVLKAQLEIFVKTPLVVKRPVGSNYGSLAFQEVTLIPETPEFFHEAVYALRHMGFYIRIEEVKKPFLIALDFDGVLWDSVHECFIVGRAAYLRLGGQFPLTQGLENLFKEGRPFCRTGQDFYVVFRALEEESNINFKTFTVPEFDRLRKKYKEDAYKYEPIFYEERHKMMKDNPERWAALQAPFSGILDELDLLQKNFAHIVIATTKDEASARFLLDKHSISIDVVSKEFSSDKVKQMHHLSSKYGFAFSQFIFVDDLLDQVLLVQNIGVKSALAGWGYNTSRDREAAKEKEIPVLEIDNLYKQVIAITEEMQ